MLSPCFPLQVNSADEKNTLQSFEGLLKMVNVLIDEGEYCSN